MEHTEVQGKSESYRVSDWQFGLGDRHGFFISIMGLFRRLGLGVSGCELSNVSKRKGYGII